MNINGVTAMIWAVAALAVIVSLSARRDADAPAVTPTATPACHRIATTITNAAIYECTP